MPRVTFAVDVVTGKARPRILRNGHGYTPARTVQAQHAVAEAYRRACTSAYGTVLCAGPHVPVFLAVKTSRPLPKGRPKSMLAEPDTYKPDWDNIGKLVFHGIIYHHAVFLAGYNEKARISEGSGTENAVLS